MVLIYGRITHFLPVISWPISFFLFFFYMKINHFWYFFETNLDSDQESKIIMDDEKMKKLSLKRDKLSKEVEDLS